MLVFELTMPHRGSWNSRWSGEKERHILVRRENQVSKKHLKNIVGKDFFYRWSDGWEACVSVTQMNGSTPEYRKLKKSSAGFCGYDWMVRSIMIYGEIKPGW